MTARTLVFVNRATEAGPPRANVDVVVLDTSWVREPGGRQDLRPIRDVIVGIVERVSLFDESLARLDEWAAAVGMPDRAADEGATWWFHARGFIRLTVHELLLSRHILAELAPPGRYDVVEVPFDRRELVSAARAVATAQGGPAVRVVGGTAVGRRVAAVVPVLRVVLRLLRRVQRRIDPRVRRRAAFMAARLDEMTNQPGAILAVVRTQSFHVMGHPDDSLRGDPYVGPVVDRLAADGVPVVTLAIGLSHWNRDDWDLIRRSPNLLPMSILGRRTKMPAHDRAAARAMRARVEAIGNAPVDVDGVDLGPAIRAAVLRSRSWFQLQREVMAGARDLMACLHPAALLTGWEAARTSWLVAARHLGLPIVAIQHGVIYPNTPDYCRPRHPALVRPEATCVFGPYERDLLIRLGDYSPASVVATGSPRTDPELALVGLQSDEREQVRREIGVAPGDRLLVVSTARHTIGDEIHSMAMAARVLGGPLPGIHIVFKIHPEEADGSHYERLVAGLARAGGYPAPAMSSIREIDVYRLLRAADAHLGQYSTVLTDAVLTGTPNMVAVGQAWADIIGYVDAGVATPVRSVADVQAFMADPRPPTPEARERFLAAHYVGGDAVGKVVDVISGVARR